MIFGSDLSSDLVNISLFGVRYDHSAVGSWTVHNRFLRCLIISFISYWCFWLIINWFNVNFFRSIFNFFSFCLFSFF